MSSTSETKIELKVRHNRQASCKYFPSFCAISDEASFALSTFYGIFIVNLAVVCIVSQYIAFVGPDDITEYYLNILFFISILWLISFATSLKYGKNRSDAIDPIKSQHASNRWLKAVVAIFGFSIIIKDTLELCAFAKITNPDCVHKTLHILSPIFHSPCVFGQVAFLFLFAKHHIQECRHFARFGIIHIMATNLSVWLATVAGEATEALIYEQKIMEWQASQNVISNQNLSNDATLDDLKLNERDSFGFLFRGNCTCKTGYCKRVVQADKFLFPFLIEFCLISTCLLYVTWRKVGKKAKEARNIFKPCYKFYKAYKGPTLGALVLASTVTVIILLGAFESDEPDHEQSYITQYHLLHLYETFLSVCEFVNLLACLAGFYLYSKAKKQRTNSHIINLDVVLLFVCFIGPLIAGMFSMFSLSVGPNGSKAPGWGISLVYPIIDVVGTTIQILFILYGMQYSPTPAASARIFNFESQMSYRVGEEEELCMHEEVICADNVGLCNLKGENQNDKYHQVVRKSDTRGVSTSSYNSSLIQANSLQQSSKQDPVEKIRLAEPDGVRRMLREVIMFLVISNASLWIFLSLDKTVFSTLAYQYDYFGHGVWTTITAITTPLSIFLRMHSSACFFEMWSYA